MPRRKDPAGFLAIILIVGAVAASIWFIATLRRASAESRMNLLCGTQTQHILLALTAYAQDHRDAYPPPDQAAAQLIQCGLLAEQDLHLPGVGSGQASFFLLAPPAKNSRWGNSFVESAPLIYAGPSRSGGLHVGWNDGHVEYVCGDAAARFLSEYAGRAVPLR